MSAVDIALSPTLDNRVRSGFLNNLPGLCSNESIVIYITFGGSVIPMHVMGSDSIASVKLRICKGFAGEKHKLVFGGRELFRTESCVNDYGISNGNGLHLVLRLSDILLIHVRTTSGEEFEFCVDRHKNLGYLKRRIAKKGKGFVDIKDPIFCNGEKLEGEKLIDDICNNSDGVVHLIVQKSAEVFAEQVELDVELSVVAPSHDEETYNGDLQILSRAPQDKNDFFLEPIILNPHVKLPRSVLEMMKSVSKGLELGKQPIMSSEGTGGTYFMKNALVDKYVAIFKPADEEPLALNNPQGMPLSMDGEGLKRGTRVGEGALREVVAFLLDHPKSGPRPLSNGEIGFAGVPPTVMVHCLHKGFNHPKGFDVSSDENIKTGSLQMFMKNHGSCEDFGPKIFPIDEVHKISVFDIRTANADRHAGNILLHRDKENGRITLIPIDHGYCLPETFEDCTFDWLYWPQSHEPFSTGTIEYIKSLDAENDIKMLKFYGINFSTKCARTLRISTMLLKKGAADRGLTPFAIGNIMCRKTLSKKSMIEEVVDQAEDFMLPGMSEAACLENVSMIMDTMLDKIMKKQY